MDKKVKTVFKIGGVAMGNKGRSNVKKPKQSKEKKPLATPAAKKK